MAKKSEKQLHHQAATAPTTEGKLAALITLEAIKPEGLLDDPETILAIAENVDGAELSQELDALKSERDP